VGKDLPELSMGWGDIDGSNNDYYWTGSYCFSDIYREEVGWIKICPLK